MLADLLFRCRAFFRRRSVERDLTDELQFHFDRQVERYLAAGLPEKESIRRASVTLGRTGQVKEECRDAWGLNLIGDVRRDLGYAVRALRRDPGFTVTTVVMLALGIGANSAIFSLVDTVMLKLLPVKEPQQLRLIGQHPQRVSMSWSYPDYVAMRDGNSVFSGLASYSLGPEAIGVQNPNSQQAAAELAHGIFVSGNYFEVLGVSSALGRTLNMSDDGAPGAAPYVVLSYRYWQSHFAGDTRAIGNKLLLNGYPFSVVGVAQRGFNGADIAYQPDFFVPTMMRSQLTHGEFAMWKSRHTQWLAAIGRLKAGVAEKAAESQLFAICKEQQYAEERSLANPKWANTAEQIVLMPAARGFSYFGDELRKPLFILVAIVALVLLVACANVANLMLVRGAARQREIAVRLALGAGRRRVVLQLFTESILLAVLGSAGGLALSFWGIRALLKFVPQPGFQPVTGIAASLDWRVLVFTASVSIVTALLFGVVPAWQSTRPDLVPALKEDGLTSNRMGRFSLRKTLVVTQIALSLPLLVGAMLFTRTLTSLRRLDAGFNYQEVSIASVDPTSFGYNGQRTRDFYERLCERVAALPGVQSASLADITPLSGSSWDDNVTVAGVAAPSNQARKVFFNDVGGRFFETMGTPVILGRDFIASDNPPGALELPEHLDPGQELPDAPGRHVAIVNQRFAELFLRENNPIGMRVSMAVNPAKGPWYEIVGVAKNGKYFNLRSNAEPMVFIPVWRRFVHRHELVIRTTVPQTRLSELVRREVHAIDPVVPLLSFHRLAHDVDEDILAERFVAAVSSFFGVLAWILCAVGLYGVVAYTVTRRTREIGIRIAIGASHASVLWLVLREILDMVVIGGVAGALVSYAAVHAIRGMLFGVTAQDPVSLIIAGLSLAAAAVVSSVVAGRRAVKINPNVALRYE